MKRPVLVALALFPLVVGCNRKDDTPVAPPAPATATVTATAIQPPVAATPAAAPTPLPAVHVAKKVGDAGPTAKAEGGASAAPAPTLALPALPAASAIGAAVSAAIQALPTSLPIPAPAASR